MRPTHEYSQMLGLQSHRTDLVCRAQEMNSEQLHYVKHTASLSVPVYDLSL
jgi:hypothetical protein